jgi:hypothetical protein
MPVLPRRRHEIGQPVQEVKRREFDDAVSTRAYPQRVISGVSPQLLHVSVPRLVQRVGMWPAKCRAEELQQVDLSLDLRPFLVAKSLKPLIEDIGCRNLTHEQL